MISPAKYKFFTILDSKVLGFISFIFIPPLVIIASSIGLNPFISTENFFNKFIKVFFFSFVISFTFLLGFILLFSIITPINFCGNNLSKLFLNCLFLNSSKSLNILSSNFFSESAGFKSIINSIL